MKIRKLQEADYDPLHRLYRAQTAGLSHHHQVRRDQFKHDLLTTRFIRHPDDHHAGANISHSFQLKMRKRAQPAHGK